MKDTACTRKSRMFMCTHGINATSFSLLAVMCDPLPNPNNGFITFTEDTMSIGFMALATYGCDTGFGLSGGNRVRTCGSSDSGPGDWTGTAPSCEGTF